MQLRKRVAGLLVATALVLTACSGGGQATTAPGPDPGKPITITLWGHQNTAWENANKALIAEFEQQNQGIKVKYETFPYDAFVQKLPTSFAAGTEADVIEMFGTWVLPYARGKKLAEVPAEITTYDKAKSVYYEAALNGFVADKKLYGLPHEFNIEAGGVLINTKMAKEQGVTDFNFQDWNQFIEAAKKMTVVKDGRMQVAGWHFVDSDPITFLLYSHIAQKGGSIWASDGVHINLTSKEAKEALQFFVDLVKVHKIVDPAIFDRDIKTGTVASFFSNQAASTTRGPWIVATGKADYPAFDTVYVPLPHFGSEPKFYAESGWGKVVSAKSKNQEAAWKFVRFVVENEANALKWNATTATVPALRSAVEKGALLDKFPEFKVPYSILKYGMWVGPVGDRDRMWKPINYKHVLAALKGQETVDQALQNMEKENNAMLDEQMAQLK